MCLYNCDNDSPCLRYECVTDGLQCLVETECIPCLLNCSYKYSYRIVCLCGICCFVVRPSLLSAKRDSREQQARFRRLVEVEVDRFRSESRYLELQSQLATMQHAVGQTTLGAPTPERMGEDHP